MPEIKTKDIVRGTIKAVDRSLLAGQRMRDAYVQAKDRAEHSVYSSEGSGEEYASDRLEESAETIAREVAHQMDMVGHKVLHHKKQSRQHSLQRAAYRYLPATEILPTHSSPIGFLPMGLFSLTAVDILGSDPTQRFQNKK